MAAFPLVIHFHQWQALQKKAQPQSQPCRFYHGSPGKIRLHLVMTMKEPVLRPNENLRYTRNDRTPAPLQQLPWPTDSVSWPITSPTPLAVCFNLYTRSSKRLRLTGGENAHLFPVVSEFLAAIQAYDVSSRLHSSFTAALSPFAGLGETDALVPASEQSVKDLHNPSRQLLVI